MNKKEFKEGMKKNPKKQLVALNNILKNKSIRGYINLDSIESAEELLRK